MTTFMPPPPAATFLAFHPQDNNIIAIGMEDSSIQIYNVRVDEVLLYARPKAVSWVSSIVNWLWPLYLLYPMPKGIGLVSYIVGFGSFWHWSSLCMLFPPKVKTKLKGHQKRITGLAFSHVLNVLVSSGADSQVRNFSLQLSCSEWSVSRDV